MRIKQLSVSKLLLFNKPYNVLSQFTGEKTANTLADYIDVKNVYAAGRLDKDSEGLLLLTDDGKMQHKISHPQQKLPKSYWVQVDGEVTSEGISSLNHGVKLKDGLTKPAKVTRIQEPKGLWSRDPPVRYRKAIPTSWLEIIIREGKNRQIRRMTAAVGFPTLRIIRHRIGQWRLKDLQPGDYVELEIKK